MITVINSGSCFNSSFGSSGGSTPHTRELVKILHVATRHKHGGAERNLLHSIERERARGWDVELAVGRDSTPPSSSDVLTHRLLKLERAILPHQDVAAVQELRRVIVRGGYDVIHTHQSKAGILGRLAAIGVAPQIVHTIHMPSFGPSYGPVRSTAFRTAERVIATRTDLFVAVGEELRRMYLRAGVGRREDFHLIRSPVDIAAFSYVRDRPVGRSEQPLLLAVGTLEPRKRYDLVLRRLLTLLQDGGARLVIAGDGAGEPALRRLVDQLGVSPHVAFIGHANDLPDVMSRARLLVHASAVEGVPQVVIQALAAGLPVVATEAEGLREVPDVPITIARRDGADLEALVRRALSTRRPASIPLGALNPWTVREVDRELEQLHERIEEAASKRQARASTK